MEVGGGGSEAKQGEWREQAQRIHLNKDGKTHLGKKIDHHTLLSTFCYMSTPTNTHTPYIASQASSIQKAQPGLYIVGSFSSTSGAMLGTSLKALGNQCIGSFWALDFSVNIDCDHSRKKRLNRGGSVLLNGKGRDVKQTSQCVKQDSQKTYLGCMGSGLGSQAPAIYVSLISSAHVHSWDLTVSDLERQSLIWLLHFY